MRMMKRAFDIFMAIALALPAILISIPIAFSIGINSPGPVLFKQVRIGRHRQPFVLFKWRTMATDTANLPSHEVARSQVLPIGNFLRRTKLDELPQLWNVIRGEMSFVGPRPCLPTQHELIDLREELGVHNLRPGITGISQLRGIDMSNPKALAASDAEYIGRSTIWNDLRIIIETALNRGSGDAVRS